MASLINRWFYRLYRSEEGGGLASFEEAFGRPPSEAFTGRNVEPSFTQDPPADPDDEETPPAAGAPADDPDGDEGDGAAPGEGEEGEGDDELADWQQEMAARGFEPDAFNEVGWRTYRNMEIAFSQRTPAAEEPVVEETPPPPRPLGGVAEIQTEEQLYGEAQTRPRETAMWALENRERLSDEQYNNVMNMWFVSNPNEYQEFRERALIQGMLEHVGERFQHETAFQMDQARDAGINMALAESPLIEQYRQPLGQYLKDNAHLNDWINNLRSPAEVKSAIEAVFYMMAGPELGRMVVEQKAAAEAARIEAETAEGENGAAADTAAASARTTRRSATPRSSVPGQQLSDEEYAKGIQDKILNIGKPQAR